MAFVPASGVARAELIYLQHGQRVENVFHIRVQAQGPLTEAQLDSVAALVKSWRDTNLRPSQHNLVVLQQTEVRDMTSADALAKIYPCVTNCAGGLASGGIHPGNVTVAIKWGTGYAGRSRRGRTFHVGLGQGATTGNQLIAGTQSTLQAAYQALITACTAAGYTLVVYSRVNQGVQRQDALLTPILSASVEVNLDSMRRRLTGPGRGE